MITVNKISKTFHKGEATEIAALKSVSIHIEDQDFIVITGSNGSGKSTLLNCIAGSVIPDSGFIYIADKKVEDWPDFKRSKYISRIFQDPLMGTAQELSIRDNLRLAALRTKSKLLSIGTTKDFEDRARQQLRTLKMGLENHIDKPVNTLSGGQRQALTLLMAVMADCKVMLLDEPTAALDPRSASLVMEKAAEIIYTHKITAILVTHHLKDALQFGNRILSMSEGEIAKDISGGEKKRLTLEELVKWYD